jgi:hypothetical protein
MTGARSLDYGLAPGLISKIAPAFTLKAGSASHQILLFKNAGRKDSKHSNNLNKVTQLFDTSWPITSCGS